MECLSKGFKSCMHSVTLVGHPARALVKGSKVTRIPSSHDFKCPKITLQTISKLQMSPCIMLCSYNFKLSKCHLVFSTTFDFWFQVSDDNYDLFFYQENNATIQLLLRFTTRIGFQFLFVQGQQPT